MIPLRLRLAAAAIAAALAAPVAAQNLSPITFYPGDTQIGPSVQTQDWPAIAAGGGGYLVVWDDKRPVLESIGSTPTGVAFQGNGTDIYAALLAADGSVLKSPIIIANQGRNQVRPSVAWNGEAFLVVWTSERPDWYFFEDIMAMRVSAAGELLDSEPFVLRPELDVPFRPNDHAQNPRVGSDGTNWVVVLEDGIWIESDIIPGVFNRRPNISALRVAPDGALIDPTPVVIFQHDSVAFGPTVPDLAFAGDEFLVVWERSGSWGRRIDLNLQPLDASAFEIAPFGSQPRVASNGTDFLVVTAQNAAYRITHAGAVLEGPFGIDFDTGGTMSQPAGPALAWNGTHYTVAFGDGADAFADSHLYTVEIGPDGGVTGPAATLTTPDFEWKPAVASAGDGTAQIALATRDDLVAQNIRGVPLDANGAPGSTRELSVGLHRQAYLRFASNGDQHMAMFVSDGEGLRRIMVQRVTSAGIAIDTEPTVLTTFPEFRRIEPDIAFNGALYLVTWVSVDGAIVGMRVAADGAVLDPVPQQLVAPDGATGQIAVGALGDNFLVAYTQQVSGDLRYMKAARVRGTDMAALDTPFFVAFNFANDPRITALGDQWLLVWENQVRHDVSTSSIHGKFISATGSVGAGFAVDGAALGDDPDVAVTGDQALVVFWDTTDISNTKVQGRFVYASGELGPANILIADANDDQRQPAVAWDGSHYVVAWMDFRERVGIEHERADIYAARVTAAGAVLDPGGIALTQTELPEELPDVAGFDGTATIAFSILHGEFEPEVQRLGLRVMQPTDADADTDGVADHSDNCTGRANPEQRDTDGDGYGNACDADFDDNCVINFFDLQILRTHFFASGDLETDLNGDNLTNFGDLTLMRQMFFGPPGPSAFATACP